MTRYAIALLSLLALTACEDQSSFRYPCQDPANFKSAECKPPVCELDGTCSKYLVDDKIAKRYKL